MNSLRELAKTRHSKAYAASIFAGVVAHDPSGRPLSFVIPGTSGNQYFVTITRKANSIVQCACHLMMRDVDNTLQDCQGNGKTVCYHSIAAILHSLELQNMVGYVCESIDDAQRLIRLSAKTSKMITLESHPEAKKIFIVVDKKK